MCTQSSVVPTHYVKPSIPVAPAVQRSRTLMVEQGEAVRIVDARGRALCTIVATAQGPVVQLAERDTALDVAGKLQIQADAIELIARDGEMKLLSKDDVVVRGENIRLN